MAAKKTSTETWDLLLKNGRINERRANVVGAMRRLRKAATAQEIAKEADDVRSGHKRLSELRALGLVVEDEPRDCAVTGKRATTWRLVDSPPALTIGRQGFATIPPAKKKATPTHAATTAKKADESEELRRLRAKLQEFEERREGALVEEFEDIVTKAGEVAADFLGLSLDQRAEIRHYDSDGGYDDAVAYELGEVFRIAGLDGDGDDALDVPRLKAKLKEKEKEAATLRLELGTTRELLKREKAKTKAKATPTPPAGPSAASQLQDAGHVGQPLTTWPPVKGQLVRVKGNPDDVGVAGVVDVCSDKAITRGMCLRVDDVDGLYLFAVTRPDGTKAKARVHIDSLELAPVGACLWCGRTADQPHGLCCRGASGLVAAAGTDGSAFH